MGRLTICSAGCDESNLIDSSRTWRAATFSGNTLLGNSASRDGRGISLRVEASATATLSANTLLGNSAGRDGGGVLLSTAGRVTLSGNPLLSGNSAGRDGGGISLWVEASGAATLSDNNTLSGNSAGRDGGGLHLSAAGTVSIRENRIVYNMAPRQGGGIHVRQGQPVLSRNDLLGNAPLQLGNGNRAGSPHLNARDNWWGTANEAEIQRGIWDGKDEPALGMVDWQPYLAEPVFTNHPPSPPAGPSPADGAGEVARDPTLRWSASADFEPGDTVRYDVHFGAAVEPPPVSEGQGGTSYIPPALLRRNTGYFWRVVARDSRGEETWGPRWSFRTGSSPFLLYPIGNKTVNEGQTLSFTLSGNSPGGPPLTFSASKLPPGAVFDPTARRFSWTPTRDQAGTYPGVHFERSPTGPTPTRRRSPSLWWMCLKGKPVEVYFARSQSEFLSSRANARDLRFLPSVEMTGSANYGRAKYNEPDLSPGDMR